MSAEDKGVKRAAASPEAAKKVKANDGSAVKPKAEPAIIRKQVEYYFSDMNLVRDKFFHDKISSDKEGWLDAKLILSCNKIKAMNIEASDIVSALGEAALETKTDDTSTWVRRTQPLPKLDEKAMLPRHNEKKKATAHDGGVIIRVSEIPEEITWAPIKNRLREIMPEGVKVMFATNVTEKNECTVLFGPFDNDIEFCEKLKLDVDGTALKVDIAHGALLQESIKLLPKHIQKRRETQGKVRQKQRQKPVVLAGQKFPNVATVRAKVKEIIMARKDGQALVEGSPDTALIKAVIAYHPKGEEKTKGMVSLEVNTSGHTSAQGKASRCFFMVKADGEKEDISMVKCFAEMERKLAEAPAETPKAEDGTPKKEGAASPKKGPAAAPGSPKKAPASPKKEPAAAPA